MLRDLERLGFKVYHNFTDSSLALEIKFNMDVFVRHALKSIKDERAILLEKEMKEYFASSVSAYTYSFISGTRADHGFIDKDKVSGVTPKIVYFMQKAYSLAKEELETWQ